MGTSNGWYARRVIMIKKEIIDKFIFNTIRRNTMSGRDKPTRLRFAKLTDADIWRTKPIFTPDGHRYAEITKEGGNYNWMIASYPEDTQLLKGTSTDFHTLKTHIKSEMKKFGCVFLEEVRMKTTTEG